MLTPGRRFPRARGLRASLGLLLVTLLMPLGYAGPAHARRFADEPLTLTMDQLSPMTIPRRGAITVSGLVTNNSGDVWTDIGIYPLTSSTPITDEAAFEEALASDPAQPVGDRITDLGPFDVIEELGPGESATYSLRVPRRLLAISGEPGVYWFAVQALGAVDGVRDEAAVADGRVRTFLPLISPREKRTVSLSLVVPLRRSLDLRADGRVSDVEGWVADLAPTGRLGRLLGLGQQASQPITWLVDPAVLMAAQQLAQRNPGYNLGAFDETAQNDREPSDSEQSSDASQEATAGSASPTGDPSKAPAPPQQIAPRGATEEQAKIAESWLKTLRGVIEDDDVLALPFGDLDVAAARSADPAAYESARAAGQTILDSFEIAALPAVAPLSGTLPSDALAMLDPSDTVLLTPGALTEIDAADPAYAEAATLRIEDRLVVRTPWVPEGPAPGDPRQVVGTRQVIAAEAALRLTSRPSDVRPGLVLQLPSSFESPDAAKLFAGWAEQSWLNLTPLGSLSTATAPTIADGPLTYPGRQSERELSEESFTAARTLRQRADALGSVLAADTSVAEEISRSGLTSLSYADRNTPYVSRLGIAATTDWLNRQFNRITLKVPRSFLVPGETGRFPVSVRNGLNHTVRVQVAVTADSSIQVPPTKTLVLGPGESLSPVLQVQARGIGVHYITVEVTDPDGQSLTSSDPVPVRSTVRVGGTIWLIMGVGAALLFTAIAIRLTRRFLAWRRSRANR